MPQPTLAKPLSLLLLVVISAAGGALLDRLYVDATYKRQLSGDLTQAEKETQRFNPTMGLAESKLLTQAQLEEKYLSRRTEQDKTLEGFLKTRGFELRSISQSTHQHRTTETNGKGGLVLRPRTQPLVFGPTSEPGKPAIQPVKAETDLATSEKPPCDERLEYRYGNPGDRVYLRDVSPCKLSEGKTLELNQRFRVKKLVFKQTKGALEAESIQLSEILQDPDGKEKEVEVKTELTDAEYDYAGEPTRGVPSLEDLKPELLSFGLPTFSPSLLATLGSSFRSERPLRVGASARLVKMGTFGLAAGASSDFKSLDGTGADAFLTYQPKFAKRDLGLVLGGGVHLPIGGIQRVLPTVTLSFVVY